MTVPDATDRREKTCRQLIAERRLVGVHLGFDLCSDPTWDMLLDLYLAHRAGRKLYIWSVCMAANIPPSSAHRKIAEMTRSGLLTRSADRRDGRRVSIELTPSWVEKLERLLDEAALLLRSAT